MVDVHLIFWSFLSLPYFSLLYFADVFNKSVILLTLVGYEKIIVLCALFVIYHLISNVHTWDNCYTPVGDVAIGLVEH